MNKHTNTKTALPLSGEELCRGLRAVLADVKTIKGSVGDPDLQKGCKGIEVALTHILDCLENHQRRYLVG